MRVHKGFYVVIACFFLLFLSTAKNDSLAACIPPAKIVGDAYSPTSIQDAYDYASQTLGLTDFTLQLSADIFTEDLFFDGGSVVLDGGYDCFFATKTSTTGIFGNVTVSTGAANFAGDIAIVSTDICEFDADFDTYTRYTGIGPCVGSDDDCDDTNADVYPGAVEVCDGIDNNCDGQIDEGVIPPDADGDGYYAIGSCGDPAQTDDCNDSDAAINPGALDIPYDGIDQDCNGADMTFPDENSGVNCVRCHGAATGWTSRHASVSTPDGTCATCHAGSVGNILPGHFGDTVLTAGNNMRSATNFVWSKADPVKGSVTCDTCHENRAAVHTDSALAHNNRVIIAGCGNCHTSDTSNLGSPGTGSLVNDADVDALHRSDCALCHNYTGSAVNVSAVRQAIQQGFKGTQVDCDDCHSKGVNHHGSGSSGSGCVECHGHDAGTLFDPDSSSPYSAGTVASQGRGTTQSHSTHTELDIDDARGPGIYCNDCHAINNFPYFKSGSDGNSDGRFDLAETDVCDNCHSAGGAFDGINDPAYGVKANWQGGIYNADGSLQTGKEFWCVSCHDSEPANSKADGSGVAAPDKAGDNSSYGYYATGHGVTTGYNATLHGQNGPGYQCTVCHDSTLPHFSHSLGDANRFASVPDDGRDYTSSISEVCLDCHLVGQSSNGALGYDAVAEATVHSGAISGN